MKMKYFLLALAIMAFCSCNGNGKAETPVEDSAIAVEEDDDVLSEEEIMERDEHVGTVASNSTIQESMEDYRWIEGKWRYSDGEWTTELRICDFGDGLWMMTYWMDGSKEDEGTIEVYDGAIHFEGKKLGGMYFPIDAQQQKIFADGNKTRAFRYAGSLM